MLDQEKFLQHLLLLVDAEMPHVCNVAIAGGAIRDLKHGVPFKDVDFAFWNMTEAQFWQTITQFTRSTPWAMAMRVADTGQNMEDYDEILGSVRLLQVVQGTLKGTPWGDVDVDFLLYGPGYKDIDDILESHDHTISQYAMYYDEDFAVKYEYPMELLNCYRNKDRDVGDERIEKVKATCAKLGWTYHG